MFDLLWAQIFAAFTTSLLGGLHCAGMCGGFVGAMQLQRPKAVAARTLAIGYHAGRITSYMSAGALLGLAGGAVFTQDVLPFQVALLVVGGLMLLALGASLLGGNRWMRKVEGVGQGVWRLIAPVARKVYPPRSSLQAYGAGLAWGWIPCGMVYAVLPLALVAGGPVQGAIVMLAFGIGTLPALSVLDVAAARLSGDGVLTAGRPWLKLAAGAAIIAFGLSGLAHAARVAGHQSPVVDALASICHR
jgi:sulfite exporter TauE/SafE